MLGMLRALERLPSGDPGLCLRSKWKPWPLLSRCLALAFAVFVRAHLASSRANVLLRFISDISGLWSHRILLPTQLSGQMDVSPYKLGLSSWQVRDMQAKSHPLSLKEEPR